MDPINFIPYGPRPYYDHMSVADTAIWIRFLAAFPDEFEQVAYDVAIGQGPAFDVTAGGLMGAGIKRLYQLRIDVLGVDDGKYYICELKPSADIRAIGQIQGYETIFRRDYPEYKDVRKMLITDREVPEVGYLCNQTRIELVVV